MTMQTTPRRIALAVIFALLLSPHGAFADFNNLVIFGDSLSDRRNDFITTGGFGPGTPGYSDGRFSNGPIWVERLATGLRLPAPRAFYDDPKGQDFACGGVTTGGGSTQLNPDGFFKFPVPNIGKQVTDWTAANHANSDTLFTMLGGGNDFFANLDSGGSNTPQSVADNIKDNIQNLYNDDARNFLVLNLPDLGKTPRYRGTGNAATATQLTKDYNAALSADLDALDNVNDNINIYRVDLYGLFNNIIANPVAYGFTNVTGRAYSGDETYKGNGTAVADPSGYLFWDSVHPTTAAHMLVGYAALNTLPEPALLAPILLFAASIARRRALRGMGVSPMH